MKPLLLDLFCGAGGAAVGYHRAGFDVVGVDHVRQPNYPFPFVQADALTPPFKWSAFDAVHASPPCQHFTPLGRVHKDIKERYADLLEPTRQALESSGLPYVIENVPGAPMRTDFELCGSMFGLDAIRRHRWFETNWNDSLVLVPAHNHLPPRRFRKHEGPVFSERPITNRVATIGTWSLPREKQREWMGVDWHMTLRELSESIPPAYTEFIGRHLLESLDT